jgi:hypothetical protein
MPDDVPEHALGLRLGLGLVRQSTAYVDTGPEDMQFQDLDEMQFQDIDIMEFQG